MKHTIVKHPDARLYKRSKPIQSLVKAVELGKRLKTIATERQAYGIAAVQTGQLVRVFVYREKVEDDFTIVINPSVTVNTLSADAIEGEVDKEGCLSIPGRLFLVKRPKQISVVYTNEDGERVERTLQDHEARVFLHEYDHLEGHTLLGGQITGAVLADVTI